jgi:hypothetical protein
MELSGCDVSAVTERGGAPEISQCVAYMNCEGRVHSAMHPLDHMTVTHVPI